MIEKDDDISVVSRDEKGGVKGMHVMWRFRYRVEESCRVWYAKILVMGVLTGE